MLTAEQLQHALVEAQKTVACGPFCRSGGTVEDGAYACYHNGTGSGDSDAQRVYATATLALSAEQLTPRLAAWIGALHRRRRYDLNEDSKP